MGLHNMALVPEEGVRVEFRGGVEPQVQPLFSVTYSIHVDIGLH